MTRTRVAMLSLLLAAAGCNSSPTAPPPTPVIAVSQSSVSLERTGTTQITATSTVSGTSTDVTASATWRSSHEQVARVAAGLISAVGPGTATITVEHNGGTKNLEVQVRRRVFLSGGLTVTDERGQPGGIAFLEVFLDGELYGNNLLSSPDPILSVDFGISSLRRPVSPSEHQLQLRIGTRKGDYDNYPFRIVFDGPTALVDLDTGEVVGTVTLENRSGTYPDDPVLTWTFSVGAFTS